MSKRAVDRIIVAAVIIIAAAMLIGSKSIPITAGAKKDIGSAVFPQLLSILLIFLAALKMIVSFLNHDSDYVSATKAGEEPDRLRGIGSIILLALYFFTMKSVGFLITSCIYLFVQMLIFAEDGKKPYVKFGIISVVASVIVYVAFVYGLNLMLPAGILVSFL